MKKVRKNIGKAFQKKRFAKYFRKAWYELKEEAEDFFDDFHEDIFKKKKIRKHIRQVKLYGATVAVRPAYIFAERIESLLKVIFGFSILVSALLASFWGFTRTSVLLTTLITSTLGRILMIVIGFSYFIVGLWKVLHLHK